MDLELINQQIRDIQRVLAKGVSESERIMLQDNLTFLLDCRALAQAKYGIAKEELN